MSVSSLQVIAFICGIIVVVLMVLALASTDWLMAEGWRQGLFVHCIEEDVVPPLPFNLQDPPGKSMHYYILISLYNTTSTLHQDATVAGTCFISKQPRLFVYSH